MTVIAILLSLLTAAVIPGGLYVANLALARGTTPEVPRRNAREFQERN